MRRSHVAAWVALFVVINAAVVWYLRDRMSETPSSAPTSSRLPAAPTEPGISGPVLLAGAPDGSVLRVTHGNCAEEGEPEPALAWVASEASAPEEVEIPGLVEALGVGRTKAGWYVIGTDESCHVAAWSSGSLAGTSWREATVPVGAWYLDPENSSIVQSPRDEVDLPSACMASWVHAVGERVYVVCTDGRAMVADRESRAFTEDGTAGVAALAVDPSGRRVAQLTSGPDCTAGLRIVTQGAAGEGECLGNGKAPLGVAWTGDDLVAQVGFDLLDIDSSDGSWQWEPRA